MNQQNPNVPESRLAPETPNKPVLGKSKLLWGVLFLLIAAGSIWAVTAQSRDFSVSEMLQYMTDVAPLPFAAAVLCMLGFIFFEGCAIRCVSRAFSQKCSILNGFFYSATDIYFSAITPSATGGQPACALFMTRDGMPAIVATIALIANLAMYTLSILVIGLFTFLVRPAVFLSFGTLSQVLILVGIAAQIGLLILFCALLYKTSLLRGICTHTLRFLAKIRLLRHAEKAQAKLDRVMEEYRGYSALLSGHRRMLAKVFFYNLLQRASLICVTPFLFLATGGAPARALDLFALQSYTVLGSNCVPIPGAMGVSDYLLLDGLESLAVGEATQLELFSRGLSFYVCIVISGISVLIQYGIQRKKRRNSL